MNNIINFLPHQGGYISHEIDQTKFATCERYGTSVELGQTFLAMVPWKPNAGRYVDFNDISSISVKNPQYIGSFSDSQEYAGKYECWKSVDVFNLQELLDICPDGWAIAECSDTYFNDVRIVKIYQ